MLTKLILFLLILTSSSAWTKPLSVLQSDHPPLAAELSSRVAARAAHLMQETTGDPRFPFPTAPELAAIKKVAETLIMIGQEVLPAIIGEMPGDTAPSVSPVEIPNDIVGNN